MIQNYKIVTLCGSTRFKEQFLEVQKRLTLDGCIVISVGLFGHSGDEEVWEPGTKEMLDDMHLHKIDLADEIFVMNVGGYIGESTRREIAYAEKTGKNGKLYFHSALAGHKVDAIRQCDKASFCVIEQDDVYPKEYTTFFRSVIAFGRIHFIEDEDEKLSTARMLGDHYNPNDDESLKKEIESGLSRMLMICFDIEYLTGKEAIELVKQRSI